MEITVTNRKNVTEFRIFLVLYILLGLMFPVVCISGYLVRENPAIPAFWYVCAYFVGMPLFWLETLLIKRNEIAFWKFALLAPLIMLGLLLVAFASVAPMMITA